ncbi:MAG TPA: NAD-dependent epimerase/dehydratase family protein, partial [Myxococcales bacterium]|nr:NAD-dependent epimerase/dehydratase family protein [Myxococcales bacterium]
LLRAAAGKLREIVVFGDDYPTPDGTCIRDYIHVHDLARAHVMALEALSGKAAHSPVYNLGCGGRGYSVREVIDAARRVTGREIPVRIGPRRPGDPAVLVASSERIARELGFRPQLQDLDAIVESAWRFQ